MADQGVSYIKNLFDQFVPRNRQISWDERFCLADYDYPGPMFEYRNAGVSIFSISCDTSFTCRVTVDGILVHRNRIGHALINEHS